MIFILELVFKFKDGTWDDNIKDDVSINLTCFYFYDNTQIISMLISVLFAFEKNIFYFWFGRLPKTNMEWRADSDSRLRCMLRSKL